VTDFSDPRDVKRAVVGYVGTHDLCSSDEVPDGIRASARAEVQATHHALNALVRSGVLTGSPDPSNKPELEHDRGWDIRWEHLALRA
jgi:hypothetical protein